METFSKPKQNISSAKELFSDDSRETYK